MIDIVSLRKKLKKDYSRHSDGGGWREVGKAYGVSGAMAYRIANSDYEPKDPHARFLLGLPVFAQAPVCSKCGEVHVAKRCTRRKPPERWIDYPVDQLRSAFENRAEFAT
jgi:hypothetical protein